MLYQAELHPENPSLGPRLAKPVHPAVQLRAEERVAHADSEHAVGGTPGPAGELVAVGLALHRDALGSDIELLSPKALQLVEVLVGVVLDPVVRGLCGQATDPRVAEHDHRRIGVAHGHGVPVTFGSLREVKAYEVTERRVERQLVEARAALRTRRQAKPAVLLLHRQVAVDLRER